MYRPTFDGKLVNCYCDKKNTLINLCFSLLSLLVTFLYILLILLLMGHNNVYNRPVPPSIDLLTIFYFMNIFFFLPRNLISFSFFTYYIIINLPQYQFPILILLSVKRTYWIFENILYNFLIYLVFFFSVIMT